MSTSSSLPVPKPSYILRGHASPVQALCFFSANSRLLSGDADGYTVIWDIVTKRPTAVWRAHEDALLGAACLFDDTILTQGRDCKIRVWQYVVGAERTHAGFSTALPVEGDGEVRVAPWLVHALDVETLNFCSFACCVKVDDVALNEDHTRTEDSSREIYLATAGTDQSEINLYHLPSERQISSIRAPTQTSGKAGMVMALRVHSTSSTQLTVIAGYENGTTCAFTSSDDLSTWTQTYTNTPHSQPILSLDTTPDVSVYFTSAADAILARHSLLSTADDAEVDKVVNTKHSGQQGLVVRTDGKIFATAGWDSKIRVYSVQTLRELAVLKWHKEGCYSVAFADVSTAVEDGTSTRSETVKVGQVAYRSAAAEARYQSATTTHWIAAGSKDGKISLWDIY